METSTRLFFVLSPYVEPYRELLLELGVNEGQPFDYIKDAVLQHPAFCRDAVGLSPPFFLWSIKTSDIAIYLEDETNAVCGGCGFNVKRDSVYIEGICVAVEKKRYGTILINKIIEFALRIDKPKILLEAHHTANIDFYKKNGFSVLPDQERRQTLRSMSRNVEDGLGRKGKRRKSKKQKRIQPFSKYKRRQPMKMKRKRKNILLVKKLF